ncbi:hypothetical protein EXIGLDRAFT_768654 [Exidia glandulosa HHB12029]|uniref:Uncharacterized protein n=1 Tax=Exidia glandulosa HHB12029 TaxID=1314781 RepID=A0A165I324_EXIGL|nr:hypothetical protein EXIGLDRAFT_768654 [Exidia glandulosa HHB12029]
MESRCIRKAFVAAHRVNSVTISVSLLHDGHIDPPVVPTVTTVALACLLHRSSTTRSPRIWSSKSYV